MSQPYKYLSNPNLPNKKVKKVIIDNRVSTSIIRSLLYRNITPIFSYKLDSLYNAVSSHPDMTICHIKDNIFVCEPTSYTYYKDVLPKCELIQGTSLLKSNYPLDIAYNIARINNIAFHNLKYTDYSICQNYEKIGVKLINVNQGYAKCNVCIVSNQAIITSDKSIANKADDYNFDVLLINQGDIVLSDFPYGFIGGASGLISNNLLAFTGDIKRHNDYEKIINFCNKHNVNVCSLTNGDLIDFGSIIPVFE